jgi:hypothetical protein
MELKTCPRIYRLEVTKPGGGSGNNKCGVSIDKNPGKGKP